MPANFPLRLTRSGAFLLAAAAGLVIAVLVWAWDATLYVISDDAWVRANMVTVSAETSGRITQRAVQPGDAVMEGAPLVTLDDCAARLTLASLTLDLKALETRLDAQQRRASVVRATGQSRVSAQTAAIDQAAADLAAAHARLATATTDLDRAEKLHAVGTVSIATLDRARAAVEQADLDQQRAAAALAARRAAAREARAMAGDADAADQDSLALGLEATSLSRQIARQRVDLERHTIRSPTTGVVDEVFAESGEFVSPGARIALIHDPADVWIEANIKETDIARVSVGARARVTFDALPGQTFEGRVTLVRGVAASQFSLLPTSNPSGVFTRITQRVPVRIVLDGAAPDLRPGAMARIRIRASQTAT